MALSGIRKRAKITKEINKLAINISKEKRKDSQLSHLIEQNT
jgi:U3 small nucleolar RNA-associated protein 14